MIGAPHASDELLTGSYLLNTAGSNVATYDSTKDGNLASPADYDM